MASWLSSLKAGRDGDQSVAPSHAALPATGIPPGADWSWRPAILSQALPDPLLVSPETGQWLGADIAIWHDCPEKALSLRQKAKPDGSAIAPFDVMLELPQFTGSYLSLSFDLPADTMGGLTRSNILRLTALLRLDGEASVYARLNVTHGPNTETILRHIDLTRPAADGRNISEFDLAGTDLNQNRLQKLWLDLIVESPQLKALTISDFLVSRHLRANF